jgi:hypothetical protein
MRVFGSEPGRLRGCFAAFDIDTSGSQGAVLRLPEGGTVKMLPRREEGGALNYGLLVTSLSFDQQELVNFLRCFGSRIYTYAFGADLGNLTVQYAGFLAGGVQRELGEGEVSQFIQSRTVPDFLTAYRESRVSVSRKLASISLNGSALSGFIIGMKSSTMRTESNIQMFTMNLKLVAIQGTTAEAQNTEQIGGSAGPSDTIGGSAPSSDVIGGGGGGIPLAL